MTWQDSGSRNSAALFAADEANLDALLADDVLDGAAQPCALVSQIVEVGFADQATQNPLFGGARDQYVNLSRTQARQADSDITSDNQIGHRPPIFVRVTPARATQVRVRLTRTLHRGGFPSGSATLSTREQGLDHLSWARTAHSYTTDANGELLIEPGLPISMLGGGEYKVEAALPGQGFVPSSNSVKVKRRVYLRPVERYQAGRSAAMTAMRGIRSQMEALGVEVKLLTASSRGGELGIQEDGTFAPSLENLGGTALRSRTNHIRHLQPHSIAVIIGKFIDGPITPQTLSWDLHRSAAGQFNAHQQVSLSTATTTYVVVPLDNGTQLVSATLRGGGKLETIHAPQITGLNSFSTSLTVDLSGALPSFAGINTIRLTLTLKAINGWGVGWAYTNFPVIYLNMLDPNTNAILPANSAEALMIHELGHKLHLTAPGDSGQPDQQAHHYPTFTHNDVHHQGPHCSTGVTGIEYWTTASHNAASCTMWGALKTITTFCDECKTTLRKVDLSAGF